MKFISFVNTVDKDYACAAAVSAWSVRMFGGLPTNTEFILYTTDPANYVNPLFKKVFNSILAPPFDVKRIHDINWSTRPVRSIKSDFDKEHRQTQMFWTKFLCFLETSCDGSAVIYADFDMLCVDSIYSAIPSGAKTWGAVRWGSRICNNGFLVKTPAFDASGGRAKMQEPLWDERAYKESFKIWPWDDEMGPAWYFHRYGRDDFYDLPLKYNRSIRAVRRLGEHLNEVDNRMIHFVHTNKPWVKENQHDDEYTRKWFDTKSRMLRCIKMEDY